MQHRCLLERYVYGPAHLAIGSNNHVLHMVHPLGQRVDHGVHLARVGIDLGMRRECSGQGAEEVVARNRLEFVGELNRTTTGFDHGKCGASESANVGVRTDVAVVPVATPNVGLAAMLAQTSAADITIAVPLGIAVTEPHTVNHAVSDEPVMGLGVHCSERVRPIAQIAAVELGGQLTNDWQINSGDLIGHRCVVARKVEAFTHGQRITTTRRRYY